MPTALRILARVTVYLSVSMSKVQTAADSGGKKTWEGIFFSINSNVSFFLYGNFQKNLLELTVYFC